MTINLVLSVFVLLLPCPCGVVIVVGCSVDSMSVAWVTVFPTESLVCEASWPPCYLYWKKKKQKAQEIDLTKINYKTGNN